MEEKGHECVSCPFFAKSTIQTNREEMRLSTILLEIVSRETVKIVSRET